MSARARWLVWLAAALAAPAAVGACEGASHDNIDRWMTTERGPNKLEAALRDPELGADLRAHAAQNLIRMDDLEGVIDAVAEMDDDERDRVLEALSPRLWRDAQIEGEMVEPSTIQVGARDALFELRRFARGAVRERIDENLVDWLTGGYYSGRARQGRVRGAVIMRTIGPAAAPKLLRAAKSTVAAPATDQGRLPEIEDELLVGLAATASPEAVDFVLSAMNLERKDPGLPQRAMDALYQAYVGNENLFPVADGGALVPHLDRLVQIAQDETRPNRMINDAIRLLGAAGPPACIEPLVQLIAFPHQNEDFLWVAANSALQCGKSRAIVPVAEALPVNRAYPERKLAGALWEPMAVLDQKEGVVQQARILLGSESWVARIVGVELLGYLALGRDAGPDSERVKQLAGDDTVLRGWWGEQSDLPKNQRKPAPRLGERAAEVASKLAKLALGSGK